MPSFGGIVITNNGQELLAKAQIGRILNFTKMQLGSANDITSPATKTAVGTPFLTTDITGLKVTDDGKARISTYISNQDLEQSSVWREIGLFAEDPDTHEEILYAYKCAGENGETIPAGGGADIVEKIFDIIISIGNATNITATIDSSAVYVSTQDIVTAFADCEGENGKVPSAGLLYDKLNEKVDILNIVDSLTSDDATKVLSAKQGKALKSLLDALGTAASKNISYGTAAPTGGNDGDIYIQYF